jgi:hypothetical protein
MYTRDPFDVPTPQQPRPETPSHITAFWSQVPDMRPTQGREKMATTNVCRFNPQTKQALHVRGGCPHFEDVRRGPTP